jgi:predicted permease
MARSFARLRDVDPGTNARGVLIVRLSLPRATYADPTKRARFYQRVLDQAQALPGVQSAAVVDWLPLSGDRNDSVMLIEDHPLPSGTIPPDHLLTQVSPRYFATLGIPVLDGRTFETGDPARPLGEAIVSHSFAKRYWNDASPIGKRVRPGLQGPWFTIVGVVGDVHMQSLDRPAEELVYFPMMVAEEEERLFVPDDVSLALRTSGDPTALAQPVRAMFRDLDASLPLYGEQPMEAIIADATARTRFVLLMLGVASIVALLIGMVGLYGVLAYGVTLRQREIGVRMALGATARDVTRMVARGGIVLAVFGIAAGVIGAFLATRFLQGMLYGVSPTDPLTFAGSSAVLLAVAAVASWLPARRAARIDPMEALRRD